MLSASGSSQFVFGYGSLLGRNQSSGPAHPVPTRLDGFRRTWNVAMDNAVNLPGYKYYRDPSGIRPPLAVTFLNLVRAVGDGVNGVVFEVTDQDLRELDARERNYTRIEVTAQVGDAPSGTVWTYVGTADARQRYERGLFAGRAAVSRAYHDDVLRGFASLGTEAVTEYTATTDPPDCPIRELERVDLPGRRGSR